jgi:hypothetical protein
MRRNTRHVVSAVICLAAGAHAAWWFATGRAALASGFDIGLTVAQAVVGFGGALWFYARSRGASL